MDQDGSQSITPLAYSEFQQLVSAGKVKEIVITDSEIRGELKDPEPPSKKYFKTNRVDSSLADAMAKHDAKFSGQVESKLFSTLLSWIPPVLIFFGIWMLLVRRVSGQLGAGGHDEKEQTLNQLLVGMDGFDATSGVVLLAATNRPEVLDPALLRAGRFDRQVLVDRPDKRGRIEIQNVHVKKVKLDVDTDLEQVAALTPGFTGADLANLVNEAALAATRRGADTISLGDFNTGVERIIAGLERKNRLLNPREREIVAYHEMGHAIVAAAIAGSDPVHKVSIIPRGIGALGTPCTKRVAAALAEGSRP